MEFEKWRSIPRLSKESMTITEKIDGSNACIVIAPVSSLGDLPEVQDLKTISTWCYAQSQVNFIFNAPLALVETEGIDNYSDGIWAIFAQSRTRFIYLNNDNFDFAAWVYKNHIQLMKILGPGRHYGEWWGSKIQRGYGLKERRFSLFNASRWADTITVEPGSTSVSALCTVPILYKGPFDASQIDKWTAYMKLGSKAVEHHWDSEGIIVDLREAGARYKILLENNDNHKWEQNK